ASRSHGGRTLRPGGARVRHLLPAAQRAHRLPRQPGGRPGRQPHRRAVAAPRERGSRQGHLALHQHPGRVHLRRPRGLRHDELHQARRRDDLLRDRHVDGLTAPGGRGCGQAHGAPELADPHPSALRGLRRAVVGHRDPRPGDPQDARARRRDLRQAHRPAGRRGPQGHGARPLLQVRGGHGVRPHRQGAAQPL
ncbi:MAG: ATP-dependent Clp protease proteolytic subunit, partial [uncultured Solirubrobacteraceae bacterium]